MFILINSPLEQFEIVSLLPLNFLSFNFSLTNSTLFLFIATVISIF